MFTHFVSNIYFMKKIDTIIDYLNDCNLKMFAILIMMMIIGVKNSVNEFRFFFFPKNYHQSRDIKRKNE